MKKLLILMMFVLMGIFTFAQPQPQATATASATIAKSLSLTKNIDLNFGNVISSNTIGTVVLSTEGIRIPTGGAYLQSVTTGTVSAAKFTATGGGHMTFAINLPTTITVTETISGQMMEISNFVSNPHLTGQLITGSGQPSAEIFVGATLNVGVDQMDGIYTGEFTVTVNYN